MERCHIANQLQWNTFSMMKDTVTDMRKHVWPEKEKSEEEKKKIEEEQQKIEEEANVKIEGLRKQISDEISNMMKRVGKTDSKIDDVEKNLENLVERAIQGTRKVESEAQKEKSMSTRAEQILGFITSYIKDRNIPVKVGTVVNEFIMHYPMVDIISTLTNLEEEKWILIRGDVENPVSFR